MDSPPVDALGKLVALVLRQMAGLELERKDAALAQNPRRSAVVAFVGNTSFRLALSCDDAGCGRIYEAILSEEAPPSDPSVFEDLLRELTNVIAGRVSTSFFQEAAWSLPEILSEGAVQSVFQGNDWEHAVMRSPDDHVQLVVSLRGRQESKARPAQNL